MEPQDWFHILKRGIRYLIDLTIIFIRLINLLGGGGGVPGVVGTSTNSASVVTKTCMID